MNSIRSPPTQPFAVERWFLSRRHRTDCEPGSQRMPNPGGFPCARCVYGDGDEPRICRAQFPRVIQTPTGASIVVDLPTSDDAPRSRGSGRRALPSLVPRSRTDRFLRIRNTRRTDASPREAATRVPVPTRQKTEIPQLHGPLLPNG